MYFSDMIDLCLFMYGDDRSSSIVPFRLYFFGLTNLLLSPLQRLRLELYFGKHQNTMQIAKEYETQPYVVSRTINNSLAKLKLAIDRDRKIIIEGDYTRLTNER